MTSARDRTVARLRKLAWTSSLVAACATKRDPEPNIGGYAVVDPMPPPAGCPGTAAMSKVAAEWKKNGEKWLMVVTVTIPSSFHPDFANMVVPVLPADLSKVKPVQSDDRSATYEIPLVDGLSYLAGTIPLHCEGSPNAWGGALEFSFDIKKPGDPLVPTVTDR